VLVGEEEEAGEVPQGTVVLGKSKTRMEVERRGLAPRRWSLSRTAVGDRGEEDCAGEESRKWSFLLLWTVAARDKSPGAVTACTTRGGGVAGGRPRRREAVGGDHSTLRSRAHVGRDTWLWSDVGYWQVGPPLILFPKFKNQPKLCNSILCLFLCPKFTKL
jgi:hypothetical protein